jgi:hypothetical protein
MLNAIVVMPLGPFFIDHLKQKMNIILFSGVLLMVAVIFFVGMYFRRSVTSLSYDITAGNDLQPLKATRMEAAETASATVLTLTYPIEAMDSSKKDFINAIIKFEVLPPVGPCYQASVKWEVDKFFVDRIAPGAVLKIKVDQSDREIIYPFGKWASLCKN